ncbi:MAG: hypothetical protein JO121_29330 [Deltaproteobacteria bacterium]|nr:hypothetical protein [Deltaproteobacteria bacterium]
MLARPRIAQAGGQALVARWVDLSIEEQPSQSAWLSGEVSAEASSSPKHAEESELVRLAERQVGAQRRSPLPAPLAGTMVTVRPADIGVEERHGIGRRAGRRLKIWIVVEDRAHRAIGTGWPHRGGHHRIAELFDRPNSGDHRQRRNLAATPDEAGWFAG